MRLIRSLSPLALLAFTAGASSAGSFSASSTALEGTVFSVAPSVATVVQVGMPYSPTSAAYYHGYGRGYWAPRNGYIHYRPRTYSSSAPVSHGPATPVPMSLLGGYFQPDAGGNNSFDFALRGGPLLDPHVQLGGMAEWVHRSQDQTTLAGAPYQQGGTTITPTRVLSSASSDLVPMLAFLQIGGGSDMVLSPFAGIAGGYELMFISASDYATNTSYNATFGGWGWQAWAGLGLSLSRQMKITGEVFMNESTPTRNVTALDGTSYREDVNAKGTGARFGLQWGF
jgi:hypothetical protein